MENPNRGLFEVLLHFNIVNCRRKRIQDRGIIIDSVGPRYSQVIPNNFPVVLDPLTSIDTQKEWIDKEEVYFLEVLDDLGKDTQFLK